MRQLESKGAKVLFLEPKYTGSDLERAHNECQNQGKVAVSRKPSDAQQNPIPTAAERGVCNVTSGPNGADIALDGNFVGSTPSEFSVASGVHTITISKNGYKPWERKLTVSSGKITLAAELEQVPSSPAPQR